MAFIVQVWIRQALYCYWYQRNFERNLANPLDLMKLKQRSHNPVAPFLTYLFTYWSVTWSSLLKLKNQLSATHTTKTRELGRDYRRQQSRGQESLNSVTITRRTEYNARNCQCANKCDRNYKSISWSNWEPDVLLSMRAYYTKLRGLSGQALSKLKSLISLLRRLRSTIW